MNFIKTSEFEKLTKKQKIDMEAYYLGEDIEIKKLLIIPSNKKINGYKSGHFFIFVENKGWLKAHIYDCWSIVVSITDPAKFIYTIIRGDFENDGFNIFQFGDNHRAIMDFNGTIKILNK